VRAWAGSWSAIHRSVGSEEQVFAGTAARHFSTSRPLPLVRTRSALGPGLVPRQTASVQSWTAHRLEPRAAAGGTATPGGGLQVAGPAWARIKVLRLPSSNPSLALLQCLRALLPQRCLLHGSEELEARRAALLFGAPCVGARGTCWTVSGAPSSLWIARVAFEHAGLGRLLATVVAGRLEARLRAGGSGRGSGREREGGRAKPCGAAGPLGRGWR
jgi:hypothetical protein